MSDLISKQADINAIADTILNGESLGYVLAEEIVSEIPSADIMECVKAIQEYCKYNECETCIFATRKSLDHVQTDKGGYYYHCGFTDGVAQNWTWGEADEN